MCVWIRGAPSRPWTPSTSAGPLTIDASAMQSLLHRVVCLPVGCQGRTVLRHRCQAVHGMDRSVHLWRQWGRHPILSRLRDHIAQPTADDRRPSRHTDRIYANSIVKASRLWSTFTSSLHWVMKHLRSLTVALFPQPKLSFATTPKRSIKRGRRLRTELRHGGETLPQALRDHAGADCLKVSNWCGGIHGMLANTWL